MGGQASRQTKTELSCVFYDAKDKDKVKLTIFS